MLRTRPAPFGVRARRKRVTGSCLLLPGTYGGRMSYHFDVNEAHARSGELPMKYEIANDARPQAKALLAAAALSLALWFVPYAWVLTYPFQLFVTFIHE